MRRNNLCRDSSDAQAKFLTRDEARRVTANIAKLPGISQKRSSPVGMTPLVSSQRIRSQRGLIRRIGPTAPANPAHSGQTLLRCCEPAIRGPSPREIVIGTPQIVLRRSRFFKATESGKHTKDEQRTPHGNLLVIPVTKSGQWLISQVEPAESVDAAHGPRALYKML
jgi:hypothetical protein